MQTSKLEFLLNSFTYKKKILNKTKKKKKRVKIDIECVTINEDVRCNDMNVDFVSHNLIKSCHSYAMLD